MCQNCLVHILHKILYVQHLPTWNLTSRQSTCSILLSNMTHVWARQVGQHPSWQPRRIWVADHDVNGKKVEIRSHSNGHEFETHCTTVDKDLSKFEKYTLIPGLSIIVFFGISSGGASFPTLIPQTLGKWVSCSTVTWDDSSIMCWFSSLYSWKKTLNIWSKLYIFEQLANFAFASKNYTQNSLWKFAQNRGWTFRPKASWNFGERLPKILPKIAFQKFPPP